MFTRKQKKTKTASRKVTKPKRTKMRQKLKVKFQEKLRSTIKKNSNYQSKSKRGGEKQKNT